jgi:hypothetical protein
MTQLLRLLSLTLLITFTLSDHVSAQSRTGGSRPKVQLPHDRVGSDHGSVGFFQQQVGGAAKPRKPKTNTLCAPVGAGRPVRC